MCSGSGRPERVGSSARCSWASSGAASLSSWPPRGRNGPYCGRAPGVGNGRARGRCTLQCPDDAHRWGSGSYRTRTSYASAPRPAGADRGAQAVLGATRQSGGLLRVGGRVCLRTPVPPPRVAPSQQSLAGRPLGAASRRWITRLPTARPRAHRRARPRTRWPCPQPCHQARDAPAPSGLEAFLQRTDLP